MIKKSMDNWGLKYGLRSYFFKNEPLISCPFLSPILQFFDYRRFILKEITSLKNPYFSKILSTSSFSIEIIRQ